MTNEQEQQRKVERRRAKTAGLLAQGAGRTLGVVIRLPLGEELARLSQADDPVELEAGDAALAREALQLAVRRAGVPGSLTSKVLRRVAAQLASATPTTSGPWCSVSGWGEHAPVEHARPRQ